MTQTSESSNSSSSERAVSVPQDCGKLITVMHDWHPVVAEMLLLLRKGTANERYEEIMSQRGGKTLLDLCWTYYIEKKSEDLEAVVSAVTEFLNTALVKRTFNLRNHKFRLIIQTKPYFATVWLMNRVDDMRNTKIQPYSGYKLRINFPHAQYNTRALLVMARLRNILSGYARDDTQPAPVFYSFKWKRMIHSSVKPGEVTATDHGGQVTIYVHRAASLSAIHVFIDEMHELMVSLGFPITEGVALERDFPVKTRTGKTTMLSMRRGTVDDVYIDKSLLDDSPTLTILLHALQSDSKYFAVLSAMTKPRATEEDQIHWQLSCLVLDYQRALQKRKKDKVSKSDWSDYKSIMLKKMGVLLDARAKQKRSKAFDPHALPLLGGDARHAVIDLIMADNRSLLQCVKQRVYLKYFDLVLFYGYCCYENDYPLDPSIIRGMPFEKIKASVDEFLKINPDRNREFNMEVTKLSEYGAVADWLWSKKPLIKVYSVLWCYQNQFSKDDGHNPDYVAIRVICRHMLALYFTDDNRQEKPEAMKTDRVLDELDSIFDAARPRCAK
ncbi:MAG: hypothetical protein P1U34_08025 [Coxiellaceae bacterium]|nr:hypothetical protein [Coxiellaceae bacterium]